MIKTSELEIDLFLKICHNTLLWFLTQCIDQSKCSTEQLEGLLKKIKAFKTIDEQKIFMLTNFTLYARTIFKIDNEVKNFSVGLAAIKDSETEKWGFIDTHFTLIIPAIYEDVQSFNIFGSALVKQNGYWIMINKYNHAMN